METLKNWRAKEVQFLEQIALQSRTLATQAQTIKCLKEELAWLKKQVFGKKSEKEIPLKNDGDFFPGFEPTTIFDQEPKKTLFNLLGFDSLQLAA